MINPLRSEQEAFRFTLIVAALVAPILLAAILFGSGVALGVAAGLATGVLGALFVLKRDERPERMEVRRVADDRRRILVVANETLTGRALRREIAHRARGSDSEIRVVCPALNTKIKHWVSDEDAARREAQERLEALLGQLSEEGLEAEGHIGDDDPVQAMEDALRQFPAEEAIISTHPPGRSNWLERGVVERARERFAIPVNHVVVDLEHEQAYAGPAGARPNES